MLKVTIGVALLLLIALVGYRQTFTRIRLPAASRLVFLTGTEFILIGLALGDEFIGLLDETTIRSLTPIFSLGLGAIGLIFGIQLDFSVIRRFPSRYLAMAATQAIVTFLVVFAAFFDQMSDSFEHCLIDFAGGFSGDAEFVLTNKLRSGTLVMAKDLESAFDAPFDQREEFEMR